MPIFTSLLFFFIALAFLPLALRNSRARTALRQQSELDDRMALGASICIAATREAFGVELDHSLDSIHTLDILISQGWSDSPAEQTESNGKPNDLTFVLASYLGTAISEHTGARWRIENGKTVLFFQEHSVSAFPFDLIERKLRDPEQVHLEEEIERWGKPTENVTDVDQYEGPPE
ncbi:MAG TPA: hypothetical protein VFH95_11940 [Candidatus Kapabacteria bacterium]|nr:hypothetical protein [Candidatus Kapabacteria bacterium]